jgi:hypothetical protein
MNNNMFVSLRLIMGTAALAVGMTASAYTNARTMLYTEKIDRDIRRGAELEAVQTIHLLEKTGDPEALPYFAEKSLDTAAPETVRERAAQAYVKIASLEEGADFLQKYCADPTIKSGKWLLVQQYLDKYGEHGKNGVSDAAGTHILSVLLTIMQTTDVRDAANRINQHLLRSIPQYTNSAQRASLVRFATTGNEWVTNTFHPIKAHFDNIPPSKRIDLRKRFPDLPPLPVEPEKASFPIPSAWVGGALGLIAVCIASIAFLRKLEKGKRL